MIIYTGIYIKPLEMNKNLEFVYRKMTQMMS